MANSCDENSGETGDRLKGWKEIAAFLRVHPRTVQRWVDRGLPVPVHRIHTTHGSIVYAAKPELDAWMRTDGAREAGVVEHWNDSSCFEVEEDISLAETSRSSGPALEAPVSRAGFGAESRPPAALSPATGAEEALLTPRRRLPRLVIVGFVSVALVVGLGLLYIYIWRGPAIRSASAITPANSIRTIALRLTFADGTTGRIGLLPGRPATLRARGQTLVLSIEPLSNGTSLRICRLEGDDDALVEVAAVRLERGKAVPLPERSEIAVVEWLAAVSTPSTPNGGTRTQKPTPSAPADQK